MMQVKSVSGPMSACWKVLKPARQTHQTDQQQSRAVTRVHGELLFMRIYWKQLAGSRVSAPVSETRCNRARSAVPTHESVSAMPPQAQLCEQHADGEFTKAACFAGWLCLSLATLQLVPER